MPTQVSRYRRPEPAAFEQRGAPRLKLSIALTKATGRGRRPLNATLHDLSIYGCRLETGVATEAGERLWLRLGGDAIAADVVWREDSMIGCRFVAPIERATMRALALRIT